MSTTPNTVKIPQIPPELWTVRDAAIELALSNAPLPPDMERLHEWLNRFSQTGRGGDADQAADCSKKRRGQVLQCSICYIARPRFRLPAARLGSGVSTSK